MFIEPVFGKKFFGREEVLGTLHKRVTALKGGYRQNLALTGPMLTGKSSILRHFIKDIQDLDVIPIYIEMGGNDFSIFASRFTATLLYRYLKMVGETAEGDMDVLMNACKSMIPETVHQIEIINKSIKKKKIDAAYEMLLELTSIFKKETGKSCLVILDEFHNLSNFRLKKPFQTFGKFIMVQKNTMYVVSSSQKTLLREILAKRLDLLFGNFEIIDVDGFDNPTARSFMSERIDGFEHSDKVRNYIIQITQGNPFYMEVLADRFSQKFFEDNQILSVRECLLNAFAEVLYESDGVLNQYFNNNINFFLEMKSRKHFLPILLALAMGNNKVKDIQSFLAKPYRDLGTKLQKLQEMDLVYSSGVFYKISDKLFEYWLKYVYHLKTRSMIDDMDIKYVEFKNLVGKDFLGYSAAESENIIERICELFRNFDNEKIQIRLNFKKLPRFDYVKAIPLRNNIFRIIGAIGDKFWVCHVKLGDIAGEQDICTLWAYKSEKNNKKIIRKIFIHLNGIEQNAFLLTKDQNIWAWGVKQLNEIFRLYGRFELVL